MNKWTKLGFFLQLQTLAKSSQNQLQHLFLSESVCTKLARDKFNAVDWWKQRDLGWPIAYSVTSYFLQRSYDIE